MEGITSGEKFIEDVINSYSDTVFRVAFHYVGNRADAEDISQETFLSLLTNPPLLSGERLKAWLIRVAINKSKNYLRATRRRDVELSRYTPPAEPPSRYADVFEELARLPERDRDALYLHYYEGYTAREIAHIIGGSERAVTKRLGRAREKLKYLLEE